MSLEELLRERAHKGELNYLSIAFTDRGWEVAYRGVKRDGGLFAHYDPVCAILKALTGKPGVEPPRPAPLTPKTRKRRTAETPAPTTGADEFDDLLG